MDMWDFFIFLFFIHASMYLLSCLFIFLVASYYFTINIHLPILQFLGISVL